METAAQPGRILRFGIFEVDLRAGELRKQGLKVKLQEQPFQILTMLLEHPGEVVTRDELRKKLWSGDTFVDFEHSLNTAINKIREALGDAAESPRFVETVPRRGYRFIAITVPSAPPLRYTPSGIVREVLPTVVSAVLDSHQAKTRWRLTATLVAAMGLAALGALLIGSGVGRRRDLLPMDPALRPAESIAVLPFASPRGDPKTDYLGDGITESLISNLARLPNLKVISFSSVERYRGQEANLQAVGRELGARTILTGRINPSAERLDIRVELVNALDSSYLWGAHYSQTRGDILALQEEICRNITERLPLRLDEKEKRQVEAHQFYLRGRYHWNKRTPEGLQESLRSFQQSIARNPQHALAYAGLADSYNMLVLYGVLSPKEGFPKAKEAALQALKLDDSLAEAHTALAYTKHRYDWNWAGAEEEFNRAIELNPNYAPARQWYSSFLAASGRTREALAEAQQLRRLDPQSLIVNAHLGWVLYLAGQYDQAIEQCHKTLELEPNYFAARRYLGLAYVEKRSYTKARAELEMSFRLAGGSSLSRAELGYAYAVSGKRKEAERILEDLSSAPHQRYVSPYLLAIVHTGLGNQEQALVSLQKAYEDRADWLVYMNAEPRFGRLRFDPRYQALVRRVGVPPEDH